MLTSNKGESIMLTGREMSENYDLKRFLQKYDVEPFCTKDVKEKLEMNRLKVKNLNLFINANPYVFPKERTSATCDHCLYIGARYAPCRYSCSYPSGGRLYDHVDLMKLKGVRKSNFWISHPYIGDRIDVIPQNELLEGVVAYVFSSAYSWYYPKRTSLIFIGREDVLNKIDLSPFGKLLTLLKGEKFNSYLN